MVRCSGGDQLAADDHGLFVGQCHRYAALQSGQRRTESNAAHNGIDQQIIVGGIGQLHQCVGAGDQIHAQLFKRGASVVAHCGAGDRGDLRSKAFRLIIQ